MVTIETIGLGAAPNDGTGDTARAGGGKINNNFATLKAEAERLKTRADLADPAGLAGVRWVARGNGTPNTPFAAPTISIGAPTGAWNITYSFTVASNITPSATAYLGTGGSNETGVLIAADGRVLAAFNSDTHAETPAGTITFDGTLYTIEVTLTRTTTSISVNSEVLDTDTHAAANHDATQSLLIGYNWPGVIFNVGYTDNTDDTNSRLFTLTERFGPYYDTSGNNGTPAARSGIVDSVLMTQVDGRGRPISLEETRRVRVRSAACANQPAAAVTTKGFATHTRTTAAPTGAWSVSLVAEVASSIAPAGDSAIYGQGGVGEFILSVRPNGAVGIVLSTVDVVLSSVGVFAFDGFLKRLVANITNTTAALYLDGTLIGSASFADVDITSTASQFIGYAWPGTVSLIEYRDRGNAANDCVFLCDEPQGQNFADSSGNANAAAVVSGYVERCGVVSADGRGRLFLGREPLVYLCSRDATNQVLDGSAATTHVLNATAEQLDPTDSLASMVFTAPCDGFIEAVSVETRVMVSGIASDEINLAIYNGGSPVVLKPYTILVTTTEFEIRAGSSFAVLAGVTVAAAIQDIDPTNTTLAVDYTQFRVKFRPTVQPG